LLEEHLAHSTFFQQLACPFEYPGFGPFHVDFQNGDLIFFSASSTSVLTGTSTAGSVASIGCAQKPPQPFLQAVPD
jgi:hypothetical protein